MANVWHETDDAIFEFDLPKVMERLDYYAAEHDVDEAAQLIDFIAELSEGSINIPEKYDYFGYIALDLLSKGEGSVMCKTCNKTYQIDQLKPTTVGHGKSPLSVNIRGEGILFNPPGGFIAKRYE